MSVESSKGSSQEAESGRPLLGDLAARRRLIRVGFAVSFGLFLAWHLWTIATAAQERLAYESLVGRDGRSAWTAIGVFALLMALLYGTRSEFGIAALEGKTGRVGEVPSDELQRRRLQTVALLVTVLFAIAHAVFVGAFSPAVVEFDALCALLSSTWHGVPLIALLHLLGTLAAASVVAFGFAGLDVLGRRWARWIGIFSVVVGAVLFLLGTLAVLRFATGSGAVFLL